MSTNPLPSCCGRLLEGHRCRACPSQPIAPGNVPFVTFAVPTYGRYPNRTRLLEEVVYWFSVQTYPRERRELILLNDAPNQRLSCYVPGVVVINLGRRVPTLGGKRNLILDAARGDIIVTGDDDDIYLPNRAANAARNLADKEYWDPKARWFEQGGVLHHTHPQNCTQHASAWRKSSGLRYRDVSKGDDTWFAHDAAGLDGGRGPIPVAEWDYVYRWGVSDAHISAQPDMTAAYASRKTVAGEFLIEPRMYRDYAAECRAIVESLTREGESCPTTTSTSACAGSATPCPRPRSSATCTRPFPA